MNFNELKGPPKSPIPKPKKQRSRHEVQQELKQEKQEIQEEQSPKSVRLRLIPIWLRIILTLVLFLGVAAIGLITGYSGVGDGQAGDALKWSTWQHLLDIIDGKE